MKSHGIDFGSNMEISGLKPNILFAFDVNHSAIGWSVMQIGGGPSREVTDLLGCGVVTFGSNDCLASKRREFRRLRRSIRSKRHRIHRIKLLLKHLSIFSDQELNQAGCAWPWLLAARVLRGGELLNWKEMWDVLRWYAHNRGYDGNQNWCSQKEENYLKPILLK